jgi:hypothetical protein
MPRAEELQRQRTPVQDHAHDAYVDGLPISEGKKAFLKQFPELMRDDLAPIATKVYQQALASGIEDDSPQLYETILQGVISEIGQLALSPTRFVVDKVPGLR